MLLTVADPLLGFLGHPSCAVKLAHVFRAERSARGLMWPELQRIRQFENQVGPATPARSPCISDRGPPATEPLSGI